MTTNSPRTPRRMMCGRGSLLTLALVIGAAGFPALAQDSEVLTKIEVIGVVKQPTDTVLFKAGVKEGDNLRNIDLTVVLERLWATGAFDDIKFETEDLPEGKKLIIRVVERPIIKEVDYRGGSEVGLSSLKDKIKEKKLIINPDSVYDPEATRKVKSLIVEEVAEKGYRNPVIDVSLEPMAPGVSRLVFDIKEGGKVKIYKVSFRGNKIFSSSKLRSIMKKSRQHWMFSWLTGHDKLVDKILDEDIQEIKKAYWRLGYKDVFVGQPTIDIVDKTSPRQLKKNKHKVEQGKSPKFDLRASLVVPILEGDRFYEGDLKFEGNDKVMTGKQGEAYMRWKIAEAHRDGSSPISKFLNIKPDAKPLAPGKLRAFDLDALTQGLSKIKEDYSNMGYVAFHADKTLTVRQDGDVKKVDVAVKIEEGEIYTIRKINFEGNDTTKDKVLRRALLVKEGDPFRMEVFKDSFTSMGQLGFFDVKGEDPKIEPVEDKPMVDITIKGQEAGVNELMFNGGFGSVYGFTLGMTFSTHNLGGGGETLSFAYQGGKYQKNMSASYTEPYIKDLPYSFSVSVGNSKTDYDASRVGTFYAYKQTTKSIGLSLGTRLSTFMDTPKDWAYFTSMSTGYSFRVVDIKGAQSPIYKDLNNQLTSSISWGINYSTVNHPYKPSAGTKMSFGMEYGGWQFGTDKAFYRASWEFTKWGNFSDRHIFGMNLSYGYMRNLSNDDYAAYDLYRPGGENSIRGYRYGYIGSTVTNSTGTPLAIGGNKQFIANFEYHFKIAEQFRTVLFYDAGNAWGPGTRVLSRDLTTYYNDAGQLLNYKNASLMRSMGVEIRFFLPISPAPMRMIWSRKLNPYPWDTEGKTDFQFSIGTTF